ncbi:MAG: hypothetical protein JWQ51_1032, partial [Tardiphaga sp.]|nr:hypothetical protein [Tardiphaga sp.]
MPRSIILQQPLDVIEFDLRTLRIAETAPQLFENAPDALDIDLAGNLDREILADVAAAQWPPQRIALIAAALLSAWTITWAIALAFA